jgi:hypothetical protein
MSKEVVYLENKDLLVKYKDSTLRLTNGNCSPPCSGGSGYEKPQSGLRPLCGFSPPHLGQGSMLRIALLPAPNVSYLNTLYASF